MSRHSFRWLELAFGMMFLSAVGIWAVWHEDLVTPRQLSLAAAGVLIVLGLVGIAATLRQSRPDRDDRPERFEPAEPAERPTPSGD